MFVVAGAGCGAAGALLAISQLQVAAERGVQRAVDRRDGFATIIGGLGTIEGPILGTVVYIVLQQTLASYNAWYLIVLGLVAIVGGPVRPPRPVGAGRTDRLHLRLFPVGYWLRTASAPSRAPPRR